MTAIEEQLREIYTKVVWTHKIQEKAADVNLENHKNIKLAQIILSAITTGTLLVSIFGKSEAGTITGAVFSAILFGIEAYTKDVDLSQKSNQHAKTAHNLWSIREDYLTLLIDIHSMNLGLEQISETRNQLKIRLDEILSSAPRTGEKAFQRASKALNVQNDHTFTSDELDKFLPSSIRQNSSKIS